MERSRCSLVFVHSSCFHMVLGLGDQWGGGIFQQWASGSGREINGEQGQALPLGWGMVFPF